MAVRLQPAQFLSAGALSLLVHSLFALAMVFGLSWKTLPEPPVYAELWTALPEAPALPEALPPEPQVEPPAMPEPPPAPTPKPVAPPPAPPKPVPEIAPPDPQIAIKAREEKERLAAEKRRVQEEVVRKQREAQLQEQLKEALHQAELKNLEEERKAAEARKQALEKKRKEFERLMQEQMNSELSQENRALADARAANAAMTARDKAVLEFRERIRAKILGFVNWPTTLKGNPEVHFNVRLLPNGEVLHATLVKSSGQPSIDDAVEKAIIKASPLPLPEDKKAAEAFRGELLLKFKPSER